MIHPSESEFAGFHKFRADDGSEHGSFEVFHEDGTDPLLKRGWYWCHRHQNCIAESDQEGPFPTAEGACCDALEGHHSVTMPGNGWMTNNAINFMDELEYASPEDQALAVAAVEANRIGNYKLPEAWKVIANLNKENGNG